MGGAADLPQRSSSPLKRRASDLEEATVPSSSLREDVDMIAIPPSDSAEPIHNHSRGQSVDMLGNESDAELEPPSNGTLDHDQTPTPENELKNEIPPIDYQIKTVTTLCEAILQEVPHEGDKVYLVSKLWLQRIHDRSSAARQTRKTEPEGEIGPIDNSDIIQQIIKDSDGVEFVQLKHGLGIDFFHLFPQEAWDLIVLWYGLMPGTIPIERFAHNTNPDKTGMPNMIFELHPLIFTVHRLWSETSTITLPQMLKVSNPPALVIVTSRSTRYYDFLMKIKGKSQIGIGKKVRVWRVPRLLPAANPVPPTTSTVTPPSSRPTSPAANGEATTREPQDSWTHLLLDVPSFLQLEKGNGRELVDPQRGDITTDSNYNGKSDLALVGLGDDQTIVLDESVNSNNFVSTHSGKPDKITSTRPRNTGFSQSLPNSGRNSPTPSGPITRGRTQRSGKVSGTTGLSNLGNTCYMNSALQCVRSVEELTKYFLSGVAKSEINYDNPLGNHGNVALAYEKLLLEIYKEPVPTSVAPRYFKTTIGKYAPSFSGYGQQDSQEFLGFLLDGLQEDLSRIKKKPYIEKPDSTDEMVNNPEAIREMAAKVWDITKKRDDSVIADLFTGMYKSTLVCPVCSKVSITFDPFNNLTLQLPIENSWSHDVFFFPLNDRPVRLLVDIDKQGSILTMKQFVSSRVGVPVERLFSAEEFRSKFYKLHDDFNIASDEIGSNDVVVMYELEAKPTNWPARPKSVKSKKKPLSMLNMGSNDSEEDEVPAWNDPLAERMLVPVFHRKPTLDRSRQKKPYTITTAPHFIILSPKEAKNEELIKRKILEKVKTFTTLRDFNDDDEASGSAADSVDPDIVLTTGSDADSSGGSKVVATSVDGEEELVDVAMKDSNGAHDPLGPITEGVHSASPKKISLPLQAFNKRRPKFLEPGSYLDAQFQNMFTLSFFTGSKEVVPSGWNMLDEDKQYPKLSSRASQPRRRSSVDGYSQDRSRSGSSESSIDMLNDSKPYSNQTRMNEESSDEDDDADELAISVPTALPVRPAPRNGTRVGPIKRRPRNMKTYSKKGNRPMQKTQDLRDDYEQAASEDAPLVRLGEGIVVDWDAEAINLLYGADSPDDHMRGQDTTLDVSILSDPELQVKQKSRTQRRKNGITLEDCLNEFGKEEILSEADTWYCPRCKEHQRASKKFELWKTPDILVMHLKRFSSSAFRRDKLDVLVDFPIEGLDLTSRVVETQESKQEIYDLFAVDDHWGGLGGGHYTAFAKNYEDGEWYEYNDSSVSKVKNPGKVVTSSAYLLFYRRRSDEPLGGPTFKHLIQAYDNPTGSGDEDTIESGEEQSLAGNTFRGSSSALTGVGAAHRQPNLGLTSTEMTVHPSALANLPAYEAHEANDEDAAPLLVDDAVMNDGLHESIEDEGIDIESNYNNIGYDNLNSHGVSSFLGNTWDFQNLAENSRGDHIVSGTGSDMDDAASDRVQNNSSASEGSVRGRMEDLHNAMAEDDGDFVDQSPVPDLDEDAQFNAVDLRRDLLESHLQHDFPRAEFEFKAADEGDDFEQPATEIHVEEGEGLKVE